MIKQIRVGKVYKTAAGDVYEVISKRSDGKVHYRVNGGRYSVTKPDWLRAILNQLDAVEENDNGKVDRTDI
jgi:hypothetical protein